MINLDFISNSPNIWIILCWSSQHLLSSQLRGYLIDDFWRRREGKERLKNPLTSVFHGSKAFISPSFPSKNQLASRPLKPYSICFVWKQEWNSCLMILLYTWMCWMYLALLHQCLYSRLKIHLTHVCWILVHLNFCV